MAPLEKIAPLTIESETILVEVLPWFFYSAFDIYYDLYFINIARIETHLRDSI